MERAKNIFKNKKVWSVIIIAILILAIVWIVVARKQKQKEEQVSEKVYQVKVMEAGETGSDVTPTLKTWERFSPNPRRTTAYCNTFLEVNCIPVLSF